MTAGWVIVVMGVSGAGKTTVSRALAVCAALQVRDADDLHPAANRAKLASGRALTDADRAPWLDLVAAWIDGEIASGRGGVIACSALKRAYRDRLGLGRREVRLVFLHGPKAVLARRLAKRAGHFTPPALLDSQLADLEPPGADERPITVDIRLPVAEQVEAILAGLDSRGG